MKPGIDVIEKLEVSAAVGMQDVGDGFTADDLEAISMVFHEAAKALQDGKHGKVICKLRGYGTVAEVGIAQPGMTFDWGTGLPLLLEVRHPGSRKKSTK